MRISRTKYFKQQIAQKQLTEEDKNELIRNYRASVPVIYDTFRKFPYIYRHVMPEVHGVEFDIDPTYRYLIVVGTNGTRSNYPLQWFYSDDPIRAAQYARQLIRKFQREIRITSYGYSKTDSLQRKWEAKKSKKTIARRTRRAAQKKLKHQQ